MKFSEQWLRQMVNPAVDTATLCEQLTMAGLEVDSVVPAAEVCSKVVVGRIEAAEQHPDAERLRCCKVNVGQPECLDIVCGAANARCGITVAVATVAAVMSNGMTIKKAKLRGQPSHGMICSASELGLAEGADGHAGILELAADAPIGEALTTYFELNDAIIDIELTPNRGDCASVVGIAREVGVINKLAVALPECHKVAATITDTLAVNVAAAKACPVYVGRVIKNINLNVSAPLWLQERLRRSGVRSINPVVDVVNYVMLLLGQPMHSFDLAKLHGELHVRYALPAEQLTLLDDSQFTADETPVLLIADEKKPLALAGIMGGADSAVSAATQHIFLESAYFDPIQTRVASAHYNIKTESSYRFERGVDYQLQQGAMELATELLLSIVGGDAGPIKAICVEEHLPETPRIHLRQNRIERILGVTIESRKVLDIFQRLGLEVETTDNGWQVEVPSFRFDLEQEVDLIEELARVYGYNAIQSQPLTGPLTIKAASETKTALASFKNMLVSRGFQEVVTYSFINPKMQQIFSPNEALIHLHNPISEQLSVMRSSLWPSLVSTLQYNQNRQASRVRVFEIGRRFLKNADVVLQPLQLALLASGNKEAKQWANADAMSDFYDVKNDIEALLATTAKVDQFHWKAQQHAALHPGQSAALYYQERLVGFLGVLHPSLVESLDLTFAPVLFEAELSVLQDACLPQFAGISRFPSIRRDLALIVDQSLTYSELATAIKLLGGELLSKSEIFDSYTGQPIETGKKSVALGLTFQHPSRTLIDEEVTTALEDIVAGLQCQFNAHMRS